MFWHSSTQHTNLQQINSAVPSGAQMHYICVARLVASMETIVSHLFYIYIYKSMYIYHS